MSTAKNAKIQFEAGQSFVSNEQLIDSGDATIFNPSNTVVSGAIAPVIRPNGIVSGLNLLSAGAADTIAVLSFTAYSVGLLKSVTGADVDISGDRPATDVSRVISITMTSAGALASVAGTSGSTTAFSEDRDAAGGPPLIPVDSVELGQIRVTTSAAGIVADSEIFQNGQYTERSDFPVYEVNNIGEGSYSSEAAKINAFLEFSEALELSHTGAVPKATYMEYYTPSFADIVRSSDFVPAETSHSLSSEEFYGGSIASSSESLSQATFKALLEDGISDGLMAKKNTNVTIRSYPDRAKTPYILTQGIMGVGRTFPIANQINASITISPEQASAGFTS